MVSAQDDISTAIDTMKYGAFDYIEKFSNEEQKLDDIFYRISEVEKLTDSPKKAMIKKVFRYL